MLDKNQTMRFSQAELNTLKSAFGNNDELLFALRKHFLQHEMTEREWIMLKKSMTPELWDVLRKDILPELTDEVPLQQITDVFMLDKIKDMTPEEAAPHIKAVALSKQYLEQQFRQLKIGEPGNMKLADLVPAEGKDKQKTYIELMARNIIVANVESRLFFLRILANQGKDETPEETQKRLYKNSNK